MANGNPFYVQPASLQGLGQIGQAYFQKQAQDEALDAQRAVQQEAIAALETNDPSQISQFMVANPQFAQGIQQAYGFRNDQTKQNAIDTSLRILQGEDPDEVLRDRAAFVSRQGGDPSGTLGAIDDPERARKLATITLAANLPPAQLEAMRKAGVLGEIKTPEEQRKIDAAKLKQDLEKEKNVFDRSKKLRDEYTKASGEFLKVRDAYGRVQASIEDPDAAGDIALIFNYMKMLDPGSVVREGEFATAQNAGGVPTAVRNAFNKLQSGERLQPEQRKMFSGRASKLFNKAESQNKKDRKKIIGLGRQYNLTEQDIFGQQDQPVEAVQTSEVIVSSPQYGDVTEADIQETMRANNLTREQVLQRLGG